MAKVTCYSVKAAPLGAMIARFTGPFGGSIELRFKADESPYTVGQEYECGLLDIAERQGGTSNTDGRRVP